MVVSALLLLELVINMVVGMILLSAGIMLIVFGKKTTAKKIIGIICIIVGGATAFVGGVYFFGYGVVHVLWHTFRWYFIN